MPSTAGCSASSDLACSGRWGRWALSAPGGRWSGGHWTVLRFTSQFASLPTGWTRSLCHRRTTSAPKPTGKRVASGRAGKCLGCGCAYLAPFTLTAADQVVPLDFGGDFSAAIGSGRAVDARPANGQGESPDAVRPDTAWAAG